MRTIISPCTSHIYLSISGLFEKESLGQVLLLGLLALLLNILAGFLPAAQREGINVLVLREIPCSKHILFHFIFFSVFACLIDPPLHLLLS